MRIDSADGSLNPPRGPCAAQAEPMQAVASAVRGPPDGLRRGRTGWVEPVVGRASRYRAERSFLGSSASLSHGRGRIDGNEEEVML